MVIRNLLNFARKNKKVFIIFMLVQVATIIAFLSVLNFSLMFLEEAKNNQIECRTYSFGISDGENLDVQMKKLYDEYADVFSEYYALMENGTDRIYCEYTYPSEDLLQNGQNISESDFNAGKKVMLFADYSGSEGKTKHIIGEQYSINGEKYEIIGTTYRDVLMIPYSSLENKENLKEVYVVLNKDFDNVHRDIFLRRIEEIFNIDDVHMPDAYSMAIYDSSINYVASFGIVIIIAIINIVYLYSYIMRKRRKETAVFRLCGCSLGKTASMCLTEILLFSVVSYILAVTIHLTAVMPLMLSITRTLEYYISPLIFVIVYVVYLLIEIISFLPIIKRTAKTSPSALNKE